MTIMATEDRTLALHQHLHQQRKTAQEIIARHRNGDESCVETVSNVFKDLPKVQEYCNAFTQCFEEEALETARKLDTELANGANPRLLHGVPICIKDLTPSKGHRTTRGSWVANEKDAEIDAEIVRRLKAAGAVIVAKTTTAEFAFSSFTDTPRYGITSNPWDRLRTAGGSSGGSGAAVGAGLVPLAEGTDMGGSVRIPAAVCGVVGFKPSLGRIPMDIAPSGLETFSHFGTLASCVGDAALFTHATAGYHPSDMLSRQLSFDHTVCAPQSLAGKRIAVSYDLGYFHVSEEVERAIHKVITELTSQGVNITEVTLPWTYDVYDKWAVRWSTLLSLLAGNISQDERSLMHPELVACIDAGNRTSAIELLEVDVLRKKMNDDLNCVFDDHDALICPTNAITAPLASQSDADFEEVFDGRIRGFDMTHPFNMVPSSPAITLPVGLSSGGLPIGLQLVGKPYEDEAVLSLAAGIEEIFPPLPTPTMDS